jgi:hypothetical protein
MRDAARSELVLARGQGVGGGIGAGQLGERGAWASSDGCGVAAFAAWASSDVGGCRVASDGR